MPGSTLGKVYVAIKNQIFNYIYLNFNPNVVSYILTTSLYTSDST